MAKVKISDVGERARVAIKVGKYRPEIIGKRTIKRDRNGVFIQYNNINYRKLVWSGNTLVASK